MPVSKPLFVMQQRAKIPADIHPSKEGCITGYEDAKANHHLKIKSQTYIYYVTFAEGGAAWVVGEEELTEWQK